MSKIRGFSKLMRKELLEVAQARSTVTYGQLMKHYGLSRGLALSKAISEVDLAEQNEGAPGFAAIVVRKDTGMPGGGFFVGPGLPAGIARSRLRSTDPKLTTREANYVRRQQEAIWEFYTKQGMPAGRSSSG